MNQHRADVCSNRPAHVKAQGLTNTLDGGTTPPRTPRCSPSCFDKNSNQSLSVDMGAHRTTAVQPPTPAASNHLPIPTASGQHVQPLAPMPTDVQPTMPAASGPPMSTALGHNAADQNAAAAADPSELQRQRASSDAATATSVS